MGSTHAWQGWSLKVSLQNVMNVQSWIWWKGVEAGAYSIGLTWLVREATSDSTFWMAFAEAKVWGDSWREACLWTSGIPGCSWASSKLRGLGLMGSMVGFTLLSGGAKVVHPFGASWSLISGGLLLWPRFWSSPVVASSSDLLFMWRGWVCNVWGCGAVCWGNCWWAETCVWYWPVGSYLWLCAGGCDWSWPVWRTEAEASALA